jgi:hypothetical protein
VRDPVRAAPSAARATHDEGREQSIADQLALGTVADQEFGHAVGFGLLVLDLGVGRIDEWVDVIIDDLEGFGEELGSIPRVEPPNGSAEQSDGSDVKGTVEVACELLPAGGEFRVG